MYKSKMSAKIRENDKNPRKKRLKKEFNNLKIVQNLEIIWERKQVVVVIHEGKDRDTIDFITR